MNTGGGQMDGLDILTSSNPLKDDGGGCVPFETVTADDVRQYAAIYGKPAAATWLLLLPPDRFDGDYEAILAEMCGASGQNGSQ